MSIRHWREAGMGCAVAAMVCAVAGGAWGGGSSFGDDDDNSEEVGASYFGFVRDTFGATSMNGDASSERTTTEACRARRQCVSRRWRSSQCCRPR